MVKGKFCQGYFLAFPCQILAVFFSPESFFSSGGFVHNFRRTRSLFYSWLSFAHFYFMDMLITMLLVH